MRSFPCAASGTLSGRDQWKALIYVAPCMPVNNGSLCASTLYMQNLLPELDCLELSRSVYDVKFVVIYFTSTMNSATYNISM